MKNLKVLIVDDSLVVNLRMKELLSEEECIEQLLFAGSAAEGKMLIEKHHPQIVLLDINLPDENGLKLLYQLKKEHPETKVIIITNHGYQHYDILGKLLGAQCLIDKAYDFYKIPTLISQLSVA